MNVLHVSKLFSNEKGFRLFLFVAEREWTDKDSGEVKTNTTGYLLSFSHPSKKIDEAAVRKMFDFASKFRGMFQDVKSGESSVMGIKRCYLDEAAVTEILSK